MQETADKTNLLGIPQGDLESRFADMGEKPFHARQVMRWIYRQGVTDFDQMTDLSKSLRQRLPEVAKVELPVVLTQQDSKDGTVKWLFESGFGQAVESVFIPEPERGTLCISSQVGCALDCAFCATGAQGFNRNLTAGEIIGQVWHANQVLPRRSNGEFENERTRSHAAPAWEDCGPTGGWARIRGHRPTPESPARAPWRAADRSNSANRRLSPSG